MSRFPGGSWPGVAASPREGQESPGHLLSLRLARQGSLVVAPSEGFLHFAVLNRKWSLVRLPAASRACEDAHRSL